MPPDQILYTGKGDSSSRGIWKMKRKKGGSRKVAGFERATLSCTVSTISPFKENGIVDRKLPPPSTQLLQLGNATHTSLDD
ncbi:uncharacterized [Tachysurus ichikawai]